MLQFTYCRNVGTVSESSKGLKYSQLSHGLRIKFDGLRKLSRDGSKITRQRRRNTK